MVKRRVEGLLLECTLCRRMRPRGQFAKRGVGKASQCKECEKPRKASAAARRRGRVSGRGGYTGREVRQLWLRQGGLCACPCRRDLRVTGYHVDHVVALSRGGMNVASNLQLLCPGCNLRKGSR